MQNERSALLDVTVIALACNYPYFQPGGLVGYVCAGFVGECFVGVCVADSINADSTGLYDRLTAISG